MGSQANADSDGGRLFRRQLPTILANDAAGILISAHGGHAAYCNRRVLIRRGSYCICRAVPDQRALYKYGYFV